MNLKERRALCDDVREYIATSGATVAALATKFNVPYQTMYSISKGTNSNPSKRVGAQPTGTGVASDEDRGGRSMMKAYELTCGCIIVALEAFDKWLFSDRFYSFLLGLDVGLVLLVLFIWGCCL